MAVYVDNFYITGAGNFGRMKMSHLVADTRAELYAMVDKIGVSRKWIQSYDTTREHFDQTRRRDKSRRYRYRLS
jgi:hypothetical protein